MTDPSGVPHRSLAVIGIGAGDPQFLTLQAVEEIGRADVFIRFAKAGDEDEPAALRALITARHARPEHREVSIPDPARRASDAAGYERGVLDWQARRAELLAAALAEHVADGERAAILVWGDPALYDSTLRLVDRVVAGGSVACSTTVVPGISSVQVLAARHAIPLNRIGRPVLVTTGRRLAADVPTGVEDVVVMLDRGTAFTGLVGAGYHIYWGAYLGTPDELLISGRLDDVADEIVRVRAAARERLGWMFDTYLLRRTR